MTSQSDKMLVTVRASDIPCCSNHEDTRPQELTIDRMRQIDSKIDRLVERTAEISKGYRRDRLKLWYGSRFGFGVKEFVVMLAGWNRDRGPAVLQTQEAYDILYRHLANIAGV